MNSSLFHSLVDIRETKAGQLGKSDLVLERARWAASIFDRYNSVFYCFFVGYEERPNN